MRNIRVKGRPRGICVDHTNSLVVTTDNHTVQFYDPSNGKCMQTLGSYGSESGQFDMPVGVCLDNNDTIMVVDQNNHRVQFFR